jgi:hypothetical protein
VNPDHLFQGTPYQNQQDCISKGRKPIGVNHPMAKLSNETVFKIRELKGKELQKITAKRFGITQSHVSAIQKGYARKDILKPIVKKECEHIITVHLGTENHGTWYECRKCDKRLKAQWQVIE